jgi:hypothetical protein
MAGAFSVIQNPSMAKCNKYMVVMYNHVFINIILSIPYKYNLSNVFINVFLESFSERKFVVK